MSKRITNRIYKSIVMLFVIMAGISYSQLADAKPPKSKMSRAMYKASRHSNSNKACLILHRKRTTSSNFAVIIRKSKTKPMAEIDS